MGVNETNEVLELLADSRDSLNTAAANVEESRAAVRPETGQWSVLECIEHVTNVEERFLARLAEAERLNEPRIDKEKEAALAARVGRRVSKVQAPEAARPTGRFSNLEEALASFNSCRAQTLKFASERAADLYSLAVDHPRFGSVNGMELLVIMASHASRHAEQIRETSALAAAAETLS
jgi:uncharacterized damage-inducible protein DinB